MNIAFFLYTSIATGVGLVACSVSLVVWLMTRRRDALTAAVGFVVYAIDLSLIFFDEYSRIKGNLDMTFREPISHPFLNPLFGIVIITAVWIWTLYRTHAPVTKRTLAALPVPTLVLMLILLPRESMSGQVQQYLYWLSRDLAIVACLAFAAWRYRVGASKSERLDMARSIPFFVAACVLIGCVIAEDTFMIMVWNPDLSDPSIYNFIWYLGERNISESILMAVSAGFLFRRYGHLLTVYARHPRADEGVLEESVAESDVTSRIALFADARGLSKREQDVLRLVLRGLDLQNIASELVISPGTVKAHLHRIYVKSEVSSREALIETFWKS